MLPIMSSDLSVLQKTLDFSISVNVLELPLEVKAILERAEAFLQHYPDPDCGQLCRKISDHDKIPKEWILCGNGSIELIYLLPRLFSNPCGFQWAPTFLGYAGAFKAAQGTVKHVSFQQEGNSWQLPSSLEFPKEAQVVFIANPSNPTGNFTPLSRLIEIADVCESQKKLLIIDEAFLEFKAPSSLYSFLQYVTQYKYVGVLRSFTKIFALPGLRLGYLVGHPDWLGKVRAMQPPWSVNGLAQAVGEQLVDQNSFFELTRLATTEAREILISQLRQLPRFRVFDSTANFLLIQIKTQNILPFKAFLKEKNIQVRFCDDYRFLETAHCFRAAVRTPQENQHLFQALKEF